jgi:dTDP-glucose 4,6-dehydratase
MLVELRPESTGRNQRSIEFTSDRLSHDFRYAIDASNVHRELGSSPWEQFERSIRKTVQWHFENAGWIERDERC